MSYAICSVSVAPIRSGATNKSEQCSQLLFGETVELLERKGRQWAKVRCANDNYVGWVAGNQLAPISQDAFQRYQQHFAFSLELYQPLIGYQHCLPVPMGARLPEFDGMRFQFGEEAYTFSGQAVFPEHIQPLPELIVKLARKYLYAPYQWGGRSPLGIDAPGLVQMVYQLAGVTLPREAAQQVHSGETVDFVEQAQAGDVAFFENKTGKVTHCGIILPEDTVIHAHGRVRIDTIDHFGIYDTSTARYTHRLRVTKRMLRPLAADPSANQTEALTEEVNQLLMFE